MGKVSVMGTFTCHDGKAEEMEAVLATMVEAASSEPGVEIYSYHRGEDNTFWFFAPMAGTSGVSEIGTRRAHAASTTSTGVSSLRIAVTRWSCSSTLVSPCSRPRASCAWASGTTIRFARSMYVGRNRTPLTVSP
jgi:hypothetical protein